MSQVRRLSGRVALDRGTWYSAGDRVLDFALDFGPQRDRSWGIGYRKVRPDDG